MKQQPFNFGSGTVTHSSWDFDESVPLNEQLWRYGQDLIMVEYGRSGLNLHIAWRQQGEGSKGEFLVILARGYEWDKPLIERRPQSLEALRAELVEIVRKADEIEWQSGTRS